MQALRGTACIITGDLYNTINAKTAHGLVRESQRFQILGIIDTVSAGKDAGDLLDGHHRDIPIESTLDHLLNKCGKTPEYAIIGMATKGGYLPESLYPIIEEVLGRGIDVINGLHQPLSEIQIFKDLSEKNQVHIYDIRKSKPFNELHFWQGKTKDVPALKIAVLGTDCGLGKRTTAKLLTNALNMAGIKTGMIYTGQTGWMQGIQHGFIFDATPNDFIPGELEHAIVSCYEDLKPEVILMEGQASLRNPGGPCGSEFIISATANAVILQHHPARTHFTHLENYPAFIPDPADEIKLIQHLGAPTWAVTLNTSGLSPEEISKNKSRIAASLDIPVVCPLEDGLVEIVELIKTKLISKI
ncbi:DUF1611 domain-containing protein [Fulvivirga sedimenti]|uniref:DUF1611 domain-containing protein n=1 Tax=Fulvivirga sedimenti TaxID=2879465 RepID=A0A9X1HUJ9_9BACT|nr:DUF1611 domain-containing protein [Fulvivirga sedimenti]MCA6078210.1 DUF1611 domain-containing protein [Fulvivirga sedimenti]